MINRPSTMGLDTAWVSIFFCVPILNITRHFEVLDCVSLAYVCVRDVETTGYFLDSTCEAGHVLAYYMPTRAHGTCASGGGQFPPISPMFA